MLVQKLKFSEKQTEITTLKNGQKGVFSPKVDLRSELSQLDEIRIILSENIKHCEIRSIALAEKKDENNVNGHLLIIETSQFSKLGKFNSKHEYFLPNEGYREDKKELFSFSDELEKYSILERVVDLFEGASLEIEDNLGRYLELASYFRADNQVKMNLDYRDSPSALALVAELVNEAKLDIFDVKLAKDKGVGFVVAKGFRQGVDDDVPF